jgi:ribosomal protein L37E
VDYERALARRWAWIAVAVTAVLTYGVAQLLHHDLGATTVSFAMFAGLFGGTAWFVGHEVATYRRCPRCGTQQTARPTTCEKCGYDVAARPRWVCEQGHQAFEPGVCDCGRRRREYVPPDVGGRVRRMLWVGLALLAALVITGLLLS